MEAFNGCLDGNLHQATVDYDLEAARYLRLPGTPSFLVNGKPVFGANPQILVETINEALEAEN